MANKKGGKKEQPGKGKGKKGTKTQKMNDAKQGTENKEQGTESTEQGPTETARASGEEGMERGKEEGMTSKETKTGIETGSEEETRIGGIVEGEESKEIKDEGGSKQENREGEGSNEMKDEEASNQDNEEGEGSKEIKDEEGEGSNEIKDEEGEGSNEIKDEEGEGSNEIKDEEGEGSKEIKDEEGEGSKEIKDEEGEGSKEIKDEEASNQDNEEGEGSNEIKDEEASNQDNEQGEGSNEIKEEEGGKQENEKGEGNTEVKDEGGCEEEIGEEDKSKEKEKRREEEKRKETNEGVTNKKGIEGEEANDNKESGTQTPQEETGNNTQANDEGTGKRKIEEDETNNQETKKGETNMEGTGEERKDKETNEETEEEQGQGKETNDEETKEETANDKERDTKMTNEQEAENNEPNNKQTNEEETGTQEPEGQANSKETNEPTAAADQQEHHKQQTKPRDKQGPIAKAARGAGGAEGVGAAEGQIVASGKDALEENLAARAEDQTQRATKEAQSRRREEELQEKMRKMKTQNEENVRKLKTQNEEKVRKIEAQYEEKVRKMEAQYEEKERQMKSKISNLQDQGSRKTRRITDLEREKKDLQSLLVAKTQEVGKAEKKISSLQRDLREVEEDLDAVRNSLKEEEEDNERNQRALNARIATLAEKASRVRKELVEAHLQLAEANERSRVRKSSAEEMEKIFRDEKGQLEQRISLLEGRKKDKEEELRETKKTLAEERAQNKEQENKWRQRRTELEEKLEEMRKEETEERKEKRKEVEHWKQYALIQATCYKDLESVNYIIGEGVSPNCKDSYGSTPLHVAASQSDLEITSALLEAGANTEARDQFGDMPLHTATRAGSVGVVKALLDKGANEYAKDNEEKTAAELAAALGKTELLGPLYNESQPLLHIAAANNHESTYWSLLDAGFPPRAPWEGCPAYAYAEAAGHYSLAARLALVRGHCMGRLPYYLFGWFRLTWPVAWIIFFLFFGNKKKPSRSTVEKMMAKEGPRQMIPISDTEDSPRDTDSAAGRGVAESQERSNRMESTSLPNASHLFPPKLWSETGDEGRLSQGNKRDFSRSADFLLDHVSKEPNRERSRPPPGLPNIGNTCYMNSVLQCFYHTLPVTNFFLNKNLRKNINYKSEQQGRVATVYGELVRAMAEGRDLFEAVTRMKQISGVFDEYLRDYGQKEPHDFLGVTLGWLHSDLASTSNGPDRISDVMSSVISDNFHIQHLNIITCEKRQQPIVIKTVSHSNLTLAVCSSKGVDLETLLANYYTPQYIQWDCDLCGSNHKCRQETIILRLPPFLIIHLSRYNVQNPHAPKVGVQFPETLDCMKKFCGFSNDRKYSIYGICAHEGTMKFGHCISVCRQSTQGQASEEGSTRKWHLCNDNTVLPKEDHRVIRNEDAHILFYEAL